MKDIKYLAKDFKALIEKNEVEIGVFASENNRKQAKDRLKTFAGGPARSVANKPSSEGNASILEDLEKKYGILTKPLQNKAGLEKFFQRLIDYSSEKKKADNRVLNDFKALFIAPILRQKYGTNSQKTAKSKGFSRFLIDTGQLLKALKVRINGEVVNGNTE